MTDLRVIVLKRIYGTAEVTAHNYSTVLSSVVFAGTIVGMLSFGYISDRMGRKFGMVSPFPLFSITSPVVLLPPFSSAVRGLVYGS